MIKYNVVHPMQARRYNAACHAIEVGGKYDVYCVECAEFIGRFAGVDVMRAIMLTVGRGGVLCPECRKQTCDECGQTYNPSYVFEDYDELRVCYFCHKDKVNGESARLT